MATLPGRSSLLNLGLAVGVSMAGALFADEPAKTPPPLTIQRSAGEIRVDGELTDDGWKGATRVETWYEVNPSDNTPPKVRNVGYIAYDDKFFYAGFEFQ